MNKILKILISRLSAKNSTDDDVIVLTRSMILETIEDKYKKINMYLTFIFCVIQIFTFFFRLNIVRTVDYACSYSPLLFCSIFGAWCILQYFFKYKDFKKSVEYIENNFPNNIYVRPEAEEEIQSEFQRIKIGSLFLVRSSAFIGLLYMPWHGIDPDNITFFPVIDLINSWEISAIIRKIIILPFLPLLFNLFYLVPFNIVIITFYTSVQFKQVTILKWNILNITEDVKSISKYGSYLNNIEKQKIYTEKLISCIKHHVLIMGHIKNFQSFCYYTLAFHVVGGMFLLVTNYYIAFYAKIEISLRVAVAISSQALLVSVGIIIYNYLGELTSSQNEILFYACTQTKWYKFSNKNRKLFLIFLTSLQQRTDLEIMGVAQLGFQLSLWIFKKALAIISLLSNVNEE